MKYIYIYIVILVFNQACSNSEPDAKFVKSTGLINLKVDNVNFDSITLDYFADISFVGDLYIIGNKIGYLDQVSGNLYLYSLDGKYITRKLGYGKSNSEIPATEITGFSVSNDKCIVFSDIEYFVYDSSFVKIHYGIVKTQVNSTPQKEIYGANPLIYSWSHRNRNVELHDGKIYISSVLKRINPYEEKNRFYNEARTIMCIDAQTAFPINIFARFPLGYKNNNWESFDNSCFDLDDNGNFYVSFEADSLIYMYDVNYEQFNTYGNSGRNMNCNYQKTFSSDTLYWAISSDRKQYGFYEKLKFDNQSQLLVRLYRRGNTDVDNDGIQIYDRNTLIRDIDIPKHYKLMGVCATKVYLYYVDLDNFQIEIRSFALIK